MDLKEICINTWDWVDSAQNRDYWRALVNAALNLRVLLAMELVSQLVMVRPFPEDIQNLQDSFEENF